MQIYCAFTTGAIAEEVLSSIRTVLAFGGEKREVERYSAEVAVARKSGIFRGILTGTTMVSPGNHIWQHLVTPGHLWSHRG